MFLLKVTPSMCRLIGHGDIRPANICVKLSKNRQVLDVWFLDFDWAGPIGIARYLTPINPEIAEGLKRPKEVVLGAVLDQRHDLDSLDAVLGRAEYSKPWIYIILLNRTCSVMPLQYRFCQ